MNKPVTFRTIRGRSRSHTSRKYDDDEGEIMMENKPVFQPSVSLCFMRKRIKA